MNYDLSILIPTFRKSTKLLVCVESCIASAELCGIKTEILIIDNSQFTTALNPSTYKSSASVSLKVLTSLRGANRARNKGLQSANAPILLFIDDDCVISCPNFLNRHIQFHRDNPSAFAAGGGYSVPKKSGVIDRFYIQGQQQWLRRGLFPNSNQTGFLVGGNLSVKRDMLIQNGLLFDEKIIYGGTETEFFARVLEKKLDCYFIDAEIAHVCHMSLWDLCLKSYKQGCGKKYREVKLGKNIAESLYRNRDLSLPKKNLLSTISAFFFQLGIS